MKKLMAAFSIILITGCASQPDKIGSQYVSEVQYQNYSCDQVGGEMARVSRRVGELQANLKQKADGDAMQMGVGMLLFWPALFFLEGGDGAEAQEYARLKGERDALERVSVQKNCGHHFTTVPRSS